ncbi:MAG TPA: hypothetical protein VKD72_39690 [Gemmataceae bacterium]|nr:hypothetical protein [Gemmataceae bacterium]
MRPPNTTFDVYIGGRLPPSGPDIAGASGHLRDSWREGNATNKRDRTFFWTAVLETPLGVGIADAYPGGPGDTTLWVPDSNGDAYTVVFVERERRSPGADFLRVYLVKGFLVAINVQEADGSPNYSAVTTLIFDQDDGFSLSQPAANQARIDMQAASLSQAGIVSLSAQSMGTGAKYFNDKIGVGTASPLPNSALDVRGYTYAYFAGILAFGGGNSPSDENDGALLQYDGSVGNKNVSLTIAAADYTSGRVGGVIVQGVNKRFALRHKTASQPKYGFYNDDTSTFTDGTTGTLADGATVTGGLVTAFGAAPSNGQLLIGNGSGWTRATLTAGSGITVTNGAGSITIAASGAGSGITSLNGLTASVQTFVNDTNVTITSSGSQHTLGWSGRLGLSRTPAGTAGQVLTGNGVSSDPSYQALPTATSGTATLGANYTVTGSWGDTGLSVTLDSGTYLVWAEVHGLADYSGGSGYLSVKLYNSTLGADIGTSERLIHFNNATNYWQSSCSILEVITVPPAATHTINLYAQRAGGASTWNASTIVSDGGGRTKMWYVKLSS